MLPEEEKPAPRAGVANFGKHGDDENNSIGSGSGDQGIDAERESEEDDIIAMEERELIEDEPKESGTHHPPPTHGLVEEGPGPDS